MQWKGWQLPWNPDKEAKKKKKLSIVATEALGVML